MVLQLVDEEPVQHIGTVVVLSFRGIVCLTISEHSENMSDKNTNSKTTAIPLHVCNEQPLVNIVVGFEPLCHCFHVHWELYMFIIVRNCLSVNGVQEWPGGLGDI